jgi:hypothetical protein
MSERNIDNNPSQQSLTAVSKEAYPHYSSEVFRNLDNETDPGIVDVEANELLVLVATHQEFNSSERLREMASVSHLAMMYLRRFTEQGNKPEVVRHAELIHGAYEQVYGQSMVELAKLSGNKPGSE